MRKNTIKEFTIILLFYIIAVIGVKLAPSWVIDIAARPNLDCIDQSLETVSENKPKNEEIYRIKTRNSELLGKKHEVTGIEFIEKEVVDAHGKKLIGVFPAFDYVFEATIDSSMFKLDNSYQFKECNRQLRIAINSDVNLKKKFSKKQLEYIAKKKTPSSYTWHHYEELGKLRLVKTQIHSKTGHTGGRSIWCDEDYKIID